VTNFFDFTVLSVLFVTESRVGGTMYCQPYTGQGRRGGWWSWSVVSDQSWGGGQGGYSVSS